MSGSFVTQIQTGLSGATQRHWRRQLDRATLQCPILAMFAGIEVKSKKNNPCSMKPIIKCYVALSAVKPPPAWQHTKAKRTATPPQVPLSSLLSCPPQCPSLSPWALFETEPPSGSGWTHLLPACLANVVSSCTYPPLPCPPKDRLDPGSTLALCAEAALASDASGKAARGPEARRSRPQAPSSARARASSWSKSISATNSPASERRRAAGCGGG